MVSSNELVEQKKQPLNCHDEVCLSDVANLLIMYYYYYTGCLLWNCTMMSCVYIIVYYARCLCFNARLTFRCCAPHTTHRSPPSNRRWRDDRPRTAVLWCYTDCMLRSLCGSSSSALNSAVVTSPCTWRRTGPHGQRLNGSIGCGSTPAALSKPDQTSVKTVSVLRLLRGGRRSASEKGRKKAKQRATTISSFQTTPRTTKSLYSKVEILFSTIGRQGY